MDDPALSVFSEARHEYMKQLGQYLRTPFLNFFINLLNTSKETTRDSPKKYLWQFQNELKSIKEWNIEKMKNEIKSLEIATKCDFLEELITAVFIAHTKVMTAIRVSSRKNKINITVPKLEHYLFKALCECSDLLWANTYLFRDDITPIEKQKNMRQVEQLILEGLQQAIRALLPVKSILKDLVPDEDDEVDNEAEAENEEKLVESKNEDVKADNTPADTDVVAAAVTTSGTASGIVTEISEDTDGTRHFETKQKPDTEPAVSNKNVSINKLSAIDSGITETAEPILLSAKPDPEPQPQPMPEPNLIDELELKEVGDEIPSVSEPIDSHNIPLEENKIVTPVEPLVFQVDTSKKVQFSDYNMGIAHDEDAFITPMESDTVMVLDDSEQAISADDCDTLEPF